MINKLERVLPYTAQKLLQVVCKETFVIKLQNHLKLRVKYKAFIFETVFKNLNL